MSARYESRTAGIWDREKLRLITPGGIGWTAFQTWIAAGNTPDPDSTPAHVPTQAELDAAAEKDARDQIVTNLRADNAIQALRTLTPAQVDNYIDTNVTDLASAKTVLKRIVRVIALLARERL